MGFKTRGKNIRHDMKKRMKHLEAARDKQKLMYIVKKITSRYHSGTRHEFASQQTKDILLFVVEYLTCSKFAVINLIVDLFLFIVGSGPHV